MKDKEDSMVPAAGSGSTPSLPSEGRRAAPLAIGARVWIFDINRRVYEKDDVTGRNVGGPIYREHFREQEIVGETTRSWLVGSPGISPKSRWALTKHPKKNPRDLYTAESKEAKIWISENGQRLARRIEYCRDLATLKEIDRLLTISESASCATVAERKAESSGTGAAGQESTTSPALPEPPK